MYKIHIIGVDPAGMSSDAQKVLLQCSCIVSDLRHLKGIEVGSAEVIPVSPLAQSLAMISEKVKTTHVAVLASGDPLFFGIGRKIIREFGKENVEIYPAVSTMQLACARFKETWDDAAFISLHGRQAGHLPALLLKHKKLFLLGDSKHNPSVIAEKLLVHFREQKNISGAASYMIFVAEDLGLEQEKITQGTLEEIAGQEFSDLNVMLIKYEGSEEVPSFVFGLQETDIAHSRGLITKNEVRAATLHKLQLPSTGVFWDIGAGSGSVALEAARICPDLAIFAIEQKDEGLVNIRQNVKKYSAHNVSIIPGTAPGCLAGLPAPDRVFIGGSGGNLESVIHSVSNQINGCGRVVINAVTEKTGKAAPDLLHEAGFTVEVCEVSVKRWQYPPVADAVTTFHPIQIISGVK